jgi:hypothetical protein
MKIIEVDFPQNSLLNDDRHTYHYIDCFKGSITDIKNAITPTEISNAFFISIPNWAQLLLRLRDRIVGIFGLKTSGDIDKIDELNTRNYKKGDRLGYLKVFDINNSELVFGMDDKHLDFRGSLLIEPTEVEKQKMLTISTVVKYNNWFGRVYFFMIKSLHKVIVKAMLKRAIIKLERKADTGITAVLDLDS